MRQSQSFRVLAIGLVVVIPVLLAASGAFGAPPKGKGQAHPQAIKPPRPKPKPKPKKPHVPAKSKHSVVKPHGAFRKLREPQEKSNHQLEQTLRLLQAVNGTLKTADHDYGGHRLNGVKDSEAAMAQLGRALASQHDAQKLPKGWKGSESGGKNWHPESQKLSNAQLAASIPVFQKAIQNLEKANHDYGGHRVKAIADLKTTMAQIETALKYADKYDRKMP
jgi:hypothetical protein